MKILDRLPFSEDRGEVTAPDGIVLVRPYQIIVMVSVAPQQWTELPEGVPRFPAILDTGTNHNFALRRDHFDRWSRLILPRVGQIWVGHHELPLLAANVWIYPNRPGTNETGDRPPYKLELAEG